MPGEKGNPLVCRGLVFCRTICCMGERRLLVALRASVWVGRIAGWIGSTVVVGWVRVALVKVTHSLLESFIGK